MNYVYGITKDDVQAVAESKLGRKLTNEEMNVFINRFVIEDWCDDVSFTIDLILEDS